MLKSKYSYVFLTAVLVLGIPLNAGAKIVSNGISLNGISLNGISLNGTALNTSQITPTVNNGILRAERGRLVIQTSTAQ